MFSSVTVALPELDIGAIAEALIYYGNTNVVCTSGSTGELVQRVGFDNIIEIIDSGLLNIVYERKIYGVSTEERLLKIHKFDAFEFSRTAKGQDIGSVADEIEIEFARRFGDSADHRRKARILADRVVKRDFQKEIIVQAKADASNKDVLVQSLKILLENLVPGYRSDGLSATTTPMRDGFVLAMDVDFKEINKIYHQHVPASHSSISEAFLLSHLLAARKELIFSSDANSDLWIDPVHSALLKNRVELIAKRFSRSSDDIRCFHQVEFEGKTFRECINSGERSFSDLVALLKSEETRKFKLWLSQQEPTAKLIKEFDRAVFGNTNWTNKLPFKSGKIVVFSGLGVAIDAAIGTAGLGALGGAAIGFAADLAIGHSDEYLLRKMLRGWKPNQFVHGLAAEFLNHQK